MDTNQKYLRDLVALLKCVVIFVCVRCLYLKVSLVGLWSELRGYFKTYLGFSVHFVQSSLLSYGGGYREHIVMPYYSTILCDTCHEGFHVRVVQGKKMPHMQSVN